MNFQGKNKIKKKTGVMLFALLITGLLGGFIQDKVMNVEADVKPIVVGITEMSFGVVFPGENISGQIFTISLAEGEEEGVEYKISKERSDKDGNSCVDNPEDCLEDLCPYITPVLVDSETDTVNGAFLTPGSDETDKWRIDLDVPAIEGYVAQSFIGIPTGTNGLHGCKVSVEIDGDEPPADKASISGYKYKDLNQNGVWDEGEVGLSGWKIQLIGCPYSPQQAGTRIFLDKTTINENPEPGISGYCSVISSTTTNSEGYYIFEDLNAGDYGVNEVNQENWTQIYPEAGKYYYLNLQDQEDITNINFFNYPEGGSGDPVCGNGILESGETCDDGNLTDGDGCEADCTITPTYPVCGNEVVESGEECDDGNLVSGDGCEADCTITPTYPVCGNGILESGEACDDGNLVSGDGCEANCTLPSNPVCITNCGGGTVTFKIRDEKVDNIEETTARFTWKTNMNADSRVVCSENEGWEDINGDEPNYGYEYSTSVYNEDPTVMSHEITVTGLKPDTEYSCRVVSSRSDKGEIKSTELDFKTPKDEDIIEIIDLKITDITVSNITESCFDISWKTNKNANSCVAYGKSSISLTGLAPSYGYDQTAGCDQFGVMSTEHSQRICGLDSCTYYYYRIYATDDSQEAVSGEDSVKTACLDTPPVTPQYYPTQPVEPEEQFIPPVEEEEEEGEVKEAETVREEVKQQCEQSGGIIVGETCTNGCTLWLLILIIILLLLYIWKKHEDDKRAKRETGGLGE